MLNTHFVNTWLILRDLPQLVEGVEGKAISHLARKLQDHYTDSVDIFVLTPDAEMILHQPEDELPGLEQHQIKAYLRCLKRALARKKGE